MDRLYREAEKRVKAKKKFYNELLAYVGTSVLLLFINLFTSGSYLWSLWAIVPWGITMVLKGIKVHTAKTTSEWERREMRKELRAMGKDPDDYLDDELELRDLDREELDMPSKGYRNSDLV